MRPRETGWEAGQQETVNLKRTIIKVVANYVSYGLLKTVLKPLT